MAEAMEVIMDHELWDISKMMDTVTDPISRDGLPRAEGGLPLHIFILKAEAWYDCSYPDSMRHVRVGVIPEESDILVDFLPEEDKTQLEFVLAGQQWFLIESGPNNIAEFNGAKKRQHILRKDSSCILRIGSFSMLLTTNTPTSGDAKVAQPAKNTYNMTIGGESRAFRASDTVLVGANPLCDVKIKDAEFVGVITMRQNRLEFNPLLECGSSEKPEPFALDGSSCLDIGESELSFELSPELRRTAGFQVMADKGEEPNFMFIGIDGQGDISERHILPARGNTVHVGRDKDNYIVIASPKMSRRHASLSVYKHNVLVVDNNSTNGVYVNCQKVSRKICNPGAIIQFGDHKFLLGFSE